MSEVKSSGFTEGKIYSPLIRFALPVLFAVLLQSLYGAVDLLVVGQFSDKANVSAVATASQIVQTLTFVITDIAMGTTILLGQMIGEGKRDQAGEVVGASIAMFAVIGLTVAVVMQFLAGGIASAMNAPQEAYAQTVAYTRICCGGAVFIVAYNVLGSIFRGIGNSRVPLIAVAIAAVFNVFGDLLFVAGFHMGAAGAAYATVISQALSVILSFFIIRRMGLQFAFHFKMVRFNGKLIRKVVSLGIPIALQDLLVSISFLIIMSIVNGIGVVASAGVGVAERLCGFIMLVPSAFMQSMSAFVAQNYGAGKLDRAIRALFYGIGTSLACGIVLGYLAFFHGDSMSMVFSKDAQVVAASADYLKAYAIDCLFTAFLFCFIGFFNGIGKTKFVMVQGIIGAFCVRVPVSFFMSRIVPVSLFKIGLATPCSTFLQITLCFIFLLHLHKKGIFQKR
jgi:putative MATE family efflux protein